MATKERYRLWEEFLRCSGTDFAQIQDSNPTNALLRRANDASRRDPMYLIALYGGLPEVAYLAPRWYLSGAAAGR